MKYLTVALLFTVLVGYVSSQAGCPGLLDCSQEAQRKLNEAGDNVQAVCSATRSGLSCLENLDCPGIDDAVQTARRALDEQNCSSAGLVSLSLVSILAGIFIALFF